MTHNDIPYLQSIWADDCSCISSPEPKAQMSICPFPLTVVADVSIKPFTFSSSSGEPLSNFQPNLVQLIKASFWWRKFKLCNICPFGGGDNCEIVKIDYIDYM